MNAPLHIVAAGALALLFSLSPAAAERLIATVAPSRVAVTSNYDGRTVAIFGAIENAHVPAQAYDVVVTVTGPRQTLVVRRKEQVAGIWINVEGRTFAGIPSYLGVFANRALEEIAPEEARRQLRIGSSNVLRTLVKSDDDPYLADLVRVRSEENLYNEQVNAVTFLSPAAFRAEIPLPTNALVGAYAIDIKLFSGGAMIAQTPASLDVFKVGVEELVTRAAVDDSLLYGLATLAMALSTGWLASVAFRKD